MAEEAELQKRIIAYVNMFDNPEFLVMRMHTQGVKQSKGFVKNPNKGMADLLILYEGKAIWVELKAKKGVQSSDQKLFEKKVLEAGCLYFLCDSFDRFLHIFTSYVKSAVLQIQSMSQKQIKGMN